MCIYCRYNAVAASSYAPTMCRDTHLSVQGACCLDIGFHHMFSALDGVTFSWYINLSVRFHSCAYTDASPGVGSLVGGEFSQSLDARLLVSVLRLVGAYWCSLLHIEGQGHYLTLAQGRVHTKFKPYFLRNYCVYLNPILYASFQVQGNENLMT